MTEFKKCSKCKVDKQASEFPKRYDKLRNCCKECTCKDRAIYYNTNKEKELARAKNYNTINKERIKIKRQAWKKKNPKKAREWALKKYGLSLEDYNNMLKNQNNTCAICKQSNKRLVVDHDHITGKTRALLCDACNTTLGQIEENVETLKNMINYINTHQVLNNEPLPNLLYPI